MKIYQKKSYSVPKSVETLEVEFVQDFLAVKAFNFSDLQSSPLRGYYFLYPDNYKSASVLHQGVIPLTPEFSDYTFSSYYLAANSSASTGEAVGLSVYAFRPTRIEISTYSIYRSDVLSISAASSVDLSSVNLNAVTLNFYDLDSQTLKSLQLGDIFVNPAKGGIIEFAKAHHIAVLIVVLCLLTFFCLFLYRYLTSQREEEEDEIAEILSSNETMIDPKDVRRSVHEVTDMQLDQMKNH